MPLLRAEIESLEQNGITRMALPRIGDPSVIPLWFGEGDEVTAEFIREAAKAALDEGYTFYTHTRGRAELRDAIKTYLDRLYGVDLNPDRISVPGSSMLALTLAAQMALGADSHALVVSPSWPNIVSTFQVTGASVDFVRQHQERGRWELDLDELFAAVRADTKAVFVNSPCNPTGWVMPADQQARLLEFCRERQILLIADEVYHRNVHSGAAAPSFLTLAQDDDPVIVVSGFSKAWAMTGWRLGWMVAPSRYATTVAVLSECFNTGATVFAQFGGIAALASGEGVLAELRERHARGRAIVSAMLTPHPRIELTEPEGAFYAFPRVHGLRSSLHFAETLLAEESVGVAPGYTFGPGNEQHFRLCFAGSHDRLEEALRRILRFLDRHAEDLG